MKPLPPRNKNLLFKGCLTWQEWENASEIIQVQVINKTPFYSLNTLLYVFQHPFDERYYCVAESWKDDKAIIQIVLKKDCVEV